MIIKAGRRTAAISGMLFDQIEMYLENRYINQMNEETWHFLWFRLYGKLSKNRLDHISFEVLSGD